MPFLNSCGGLESHQRRAGVWVHVLPKKLRAWCVVCFCVSHIFSRYFSMKSKLSNHAGISKRPHDKRIMVDLSQSRIAAQNTYLLIDLPCIPSKVDAPGKKNLHAQRERGEQRVSTIFRVFCDCFFALRRPKTFGYINTTGNERGGAKQTSENMLPQLIYLRDTTVPNSRATRNNSSIVVTRTTESTCIPTQ